MTKFLRRTWKRYSKLGKNKKKKQTWRRPTGRDNKMREKRRGYPAVVSIGFKKNERLKGKIRGKNPVIINNINDLENIKKEDIVIIGNIGKRKRIEIVKKAREKKIQIHNVNVNKFLKELDKKTDKIKKEEKKK